MPTIRIRADFHAFSSGFVTQKCSVLALVALWKYITLVAGVSGKVVFVFRQNSKSYTSGRANIAECLLDGVKEKGRSWKNKGE